MQSFLDPAILFFVFGLFAGAVRSNLEIPPQISRFLSLYLLMALGLKGGFALAKSGLTGEVAVSLASAMLLAFVVPLMGYFLLKRFLGGFDAAAIAATYGSVSAVTFITGVQYLDTQGVAHGGHMAAAMALMESPAIIMAVVLANMVRKRQAQAASAGAPVAQVAPIAPATTTALPPASTSPSPLPSLPPTSMSKILHESLTDGTQLLLLAAMVIGMVAGSEGEKVMQPFAGDLFKGMLAFFLLDMGLLAARNMGGLQGKPVWLMAYAIVGPLVHAGLALLLALLTGMSAGNAALLMMLAASASYIAVPAVIRHAIPEASPSLYFGMSLGLTFPFNILLGVPLYTHIAQLLLA